MAIRPEFIPSIICDIWEPANELLHERNQKTPPHLSPLPAERASIRDRLVTMVAYEV